MKIIIISKLFQIATFGGAHPRGLWPPNSNSAEIFVHCTYPEFHRPMFTHLEFIVLTNKQTTGSTLRRWIKRTAATLWRCCTTRRLVTNTVGYIRRPMSSLVTDRQQTGSFTFVIECTTDVTRDVDWRHPMSHRRVYQLSHQASARDRYNNHNAPRSHTERLTCTQRPTILANLVYRTTPQTNKKLC